MGLLSASEKSTNLSEGLQGALGFLSLKHLLLQSVTVLHLVGWNREMARGGVATPNHIASAKPPGQSSWDTTTHTNDSDFVKYTALCR